MRGYRCVEGAQPFQWLQAPQKNGHPSAQCQSQNDDIVSTLAQRIRAIRPYLHQLELARMLDKILRRGGLGDASAVSASASAKRATTHERTAQ